MTVCFVLQLYNFFKDILEHIEGGHNHELLKNLGIATQHDNTSALSDFEEEEELRRTTNPDDVKIEHHYKGIQIKLPMTQRQLQSLMQGFKNKKAIHAKYVLVILHQIRNLFKKMPNINYVSTLSSKRITVVGDLHGKLDDLFIILFKNGLPSTDNPYVFNGDFVDRGNQSLEVVMVLFAMFLLNPSAIFFNRGNHEDYVMNLRYGFAKEIMIKFQNDAGKIVRLFQDVFSWLPLLTIIDKKVLITHGGISDQTDLEFIQQIPRHKYLSILRPPVEEDEDGMEMIDAEAWRQLLDILWSDPKVQFGCTPNTFRGGGVNWGPDTTEAFMEKNKIKLIIRSHECKPDGFEFMHNDKVLTLFSASNYYEVGSNKGAYAQLLPMPKELKPHIIQYIFVESTDTKKLTIKQRINTQEDSAINGLRSKLLANKTYLMKEFEKFDKDDTGPIILDDFNIHYGKSGNKDFDDFFDLLYTTKFQRHVRLPKHTIGNILDLVMTPSSGSIVTSVTVGSIAHRSPRYDVSDDDTQQYADVTGTQDGEASDAVDRIERYIEEVRQWMTHHNLMLNDTKAEAVDDSPQSHAKRH
ncbi:Serine/threonine-protein phosphatase with EF-hands pef-1 [Lamellibrachia satsuma]|nr:Serine/threonine-protein phosphatase with EF-hands pef-1 [Lamellibrachia satsuma]